LIASRDLRQVRQAIAAMKPSQEDNMPSQLTLTSTLNNVTIPTGSQTRLLYLLIETGGGQAGTTRLPIHLGLVVDRSDSMMIRLAPLELQLKWMELGYVYEHVVDGVSALRVDLNKVAPRELQKLPRSIDHVKAALRSAVESMGTADHVALIVFASQAVKVLPLSPSSERRKVLTAVDQIEEMELGDDTVMGRGMALGLEELQRGASPSAVSRMIVLTDGFTLDEADSRRVAQRAKTGSISISTMGLGGSFNEDLMMALADETGGHAYNIEAPEEIPTIFQQELSAVQSISYRNLELKLNVSQGVELRAAHRVLPAISHLGSLALQDRSASLSMGDYELNAPPALLLELLVPPKSAAGAYRLAQLLLAYDDPAGGMIRQVVRQDVVANRFAAGRSSSRPIRV
jgi:hypothetical protein